MVFLDDLKDLVLYKKPFVLPINEKTIKKGSAIFLISPSFSASVKSIKSPYLVNKMDVFQSYYLEKNANYYINKEGFLQDIESTDEYLYEVGENDAMLAPAKKVEDYQGDLFFISDKYMDGAILNPRIPDNYFTQNGYEDITTPRVCFCSKVNNCLTALGQNVSGKEFYVYSPSTREGLEVWQPNEHSVPDFKVTNEYWVLKPVQLKLVGRIRCTGSVGDGQRFTYGGDFAQTYDWNYKWLEKHGETISDVKPVEEAASTAKSKFFNDFKSFVASKGGLFKDIKPLKSPIVHEAKKKKETWLLLATYNGELNKQNTSQFLPQLQKNIKYDGAEVEFHTCYLPGDVFIFIKIPEGVSESTPLQEAVDPVTAFGIVVLGVNAAVKIFSKIDERKRNTSYYLSSELNGKTKTTYSSPEAAVVYYAYDKGIRHGDLKTIFVNDHNRKALDDKVYLYKEFDSKSKLIKSGTFESLCKSYGIGIEEVDTSNADDRKKAYAKAQSLLRSKLPSNIKSKGKFYSANDEDEKEFYNDFINSISNSTSLFYASLWDIDKEARTHEHEGKNNSTIWEPLSKCVKDVSKELPKGYKVTFDGGDWDDILIDIVYSDSIKESSVLQEDKRSELPESEFGVPGKRKFPLDTPERVRSAIRFFNYVEPEYEAELAKRIKEKAKKFGVAIRCGKKNRLSKYITKEYVNEFMAAGAIGNDAYAVINGSIKQAAYQNGYKYIEDDEYPYTKKRKANKEIHKNTMMNNDFTNKE